MTTISVRKEKRKNPAISFSSSLQFLLSLCRWNYNSNPNSLLCSGLKGLLFLRFEKISFKWVVLFGRLQLAQAECLCLRSDQVWNDNSFFVWVRDRISAYLILPSLYTLHEFFRLADAVKFASISGIIDGSEGKDIMDAKEKLTIFELFKFSFILNSHNNVRMKPGFQQSNTCKQKMDVFRQFWAFPPSAEDKGRGRSWSHRCASQRCLAERISHCLLSWLH